MTNRKNVHLITRSDNASEFFSSNNHIKNLFNPLNTTKPHKELQNKFNIKWYHSTER